MNKITFLVLHLGYGGIPTSTINTANALSQKYNVEIISIYNLKNNQTNLIAKKVEVRYLYNGEPNREELYNYLKHFKLFKTFKEALKSIKILYLKKHLMIKEIKNNNSKIIVGTESFISKLLSIYKNKDTIAIAIEHRYHNNNSKYLNILKNKYLNIDYLFTLTKDMQKDYERIITNPNMIIKWVPNMIIIPKEEVLKTKENNIISISRLHPGKKVGDLVDIFTKTKKTKQFFIIGDGEEYHNIEEKINNLKLYKKVKLLGYQNQESIHKYLNESKILVMASKTEGLPMVILEALSLKLPCIAYDIPGLKDLIIDGENGFLIKENDQKTFARKIDLLLTDKKLYAYMQNKAYQKALEYTSVEVIKKWDEVIKKYLKEEQDEK